MATTKRASTAKIAGKVDRVAIRMYCLGTGDCFVLKFCAGKTVKFTMMIDCGSCQGTAKEFKPYIEDLAAYVGNHIDLLVITHEHNDHVNGFAKCADIFGDPDFTIDEAWFAWTENPKDPGGKAKKLREKRKRMRMALAAAINEFRQHSENYEQTVVDDYYRRRVSESNAAFLGGLNTLAEINLADNAVAGEPLPGMKKIKEILAKKKGKGKKKKTIVSYLDPGQSVTIDALDGVVFHVLGPPSERDFIFKEGKEGVDVYKKKLNYYESALAANAFLNSGKNDLCDKDIPFDDGYVVNEKKPSLISTIVNQAATVQPVSNTVVKAYEAEPWRKIDSDWLNSAGTLALRLNSHINNTSLALAIESVNSKKVLLFPGDAEYGSWESWHAIEAWKGKGKGGVHFVQDLLSRVVFYKVGHHLSYNGTALKLGLEMMPKSGMAAMATLDRTRISKVWKNTMPNKYLMEELVKRCQGRLFIMSEAEIKNGPSATLNPDSLGEEVYAAGPKGKKPAFYKQYTCKI